MIMTGTTGGPAIVPCSLTEQQRYRHSHQAGVCIQRMRCIASPCRATTALLLVPCSVDLKHANDHTALCSLSLGCVAAPTAVL
jgi:hypothetical protein